MDNLDAPLMVLVGPNSAGKTNVFRLISLLRDAFNTDRTRMAGKLPWVTNLKEYTQEY